MVNKNIQMKEKDGNKWNNLFPLSLNENIFNNDGLNLNNQLKEINIKTTTKIDNNFYKFKKDDNFENVLNNYNRILFDDEVFNLEHELNFSNKTIIARNTIFKNISENNILKITGSNNKIEGLILETSELKGIEIDGDNNLLNGLVVSRNEKLIKNEVNYTPLLEIKGRFNTVINSEFFNGGVGINISDGGDNKIYNNFIHDNTIGIRNSPSSNNNIISGNTITKNNVTNKSGSDGILIHRNSQSIIVENNFISNNGEHGMYIQGHHCIIKNNIVKNNNNDGIKLGSHETDLFEQDPPYMLHEIIIENNICFNNGVDGIYLQTPYKNISIIGNKTFNNYDNGIKTVYISSERKHSENLIISNNETQNMSINAYENVLLNNNIISGELALAGLDTGEENAIYKPIIRNNIMEEFRGFRAKLPIIEDNIIKKSFSIGSNMGYTKAILKNNDITLDEGINIDIGFIDKLINNKIIFKKGFFHLKTEILPTEIIGNNIEAKNLASDENLFEYFWIKQDNKQITKFINNHFKINNGMVFDWFSQDCIITNNIFDSHSTNDSIVKFRGKNLIFTNNISLSTGQFSANETGTVGIVKNNKMNIMNVSEGVIEKDNF